MQIADNQIMMAVFMFVAAISLIGIGSRGIQPLSLDYYLYPHMLRLAQYFPVIKKFYLYND